MGKAQDILRDMGASIGESTRRRGIPAAMPGATALVPGGDSEEFVGRKKHGAAALIEIDRIIPDPDQPRKEFIAEDHEQLVASLRSTGQIQPITVRWAADAGRYMLITGERRLRAAHDAGLLHLACVVHDGTLTDESRVEMQLMENACRRDLKPVEQGAAFKKLMDLRGWSQTELAAHLKIHQTTVTQALGLLSLPEPVQAVVDAGTLPKSTAYAIATKIEDPVEQLRLAARVIEEDMSRDQAMQVVRESTAVRKPSRGRGSAVKATGRKSEAKTKPTKTPTESAAHEGQGRAGSSIDAPATSTAIADDPLPPLVTHETDAYIVTVRWKHASGPPLTTIAGDLVRFAKRRADAEKEQAKARGRATGQGGEPEIDAA